MNETGTNQLAILVAEKLKYEGPQAAERQLATLAGDGGDEALALVAAKLTAAEVARIVLDKDFTSPSMLHGVVTPAQVRSVFRRIGLGWKEFDEEPQAHRETVRSRQEQMRHFLWAFVLTRDEPKDRKEVLLQILEEENGIEALIFSSIHLNGFTEFLKVRGQVAPGEDFEIVRLLGELLPEEFAQFVQESHVALEKPEVFNDEFIEGMYRLALAETGETESTDAPEDDLFVPLS